MSGPKRNPDKLNTIGVVVVGICGAVLVYVSIVALQAFYMNDTSEIQTMADYGGQDITAKSIKAAQIENITAYAPNPAPAAGAPQLYRIPVDRAIKLVVDSAKTDPALLVPGIGRADKATILPIFGRPKPIAPATPATAPAPADGAASPAPLTPTGGTGPGGGTTPTKEGSKEQAPATDKAPAKAPAKDSAQQKEPAKTPTKDPAKEPAKAPAPAKGHAP